MMMSFILAAVQRAQFMRGYPYTITPSLLKPSLPHNEQYKI
jgi:hypothetical protein